MDKFEQNLFEYFYELNNKNYSLAKECFVNILESYNIYIKPLYKKLEKFSKKRGTYEYLKFENITNIENNPVEIFVDNIFSIYYDNLTYGEFNNIISKCIGKEYKIDHTVFDLLLKDHPDRLEIIADNLNKIIREIYDESADICSTKIIKSFRKGLSFIEYFEKLIYNYHNEVTMEMLNLALLNCNLKEYKIPSVLIDYLDIDISKINIYKSYNMNKKLISRYYMYLLRLIATKTQNIKDLDKRLIVFYSEEKPSIKDDGTGCIYIHIKSSKTNKFNQIDIKKRDADFYNYFFKTNKNELRPFLIENFNVLYLIINKLEESVNKNYNMFYDYYYIYTYMDHHDNIIDTIIHKIGVNLYGFNVDLFNKTIADIYKHTDYNLDYITCIRKFNLIEITIDDETIILDETETNDLINKYLFLQISAGTYHDKTVAHQTFIVSSKIIDNSIPVINVDTDDLY